MKILTDQDFGQYRNLASYREIAWGSLLFGTLFTGVAVTLTALPFVEPSLSGTGSLALCGLGALLFGLLARIAIGAFRSSLAPENQILRWSGHGIYLRFRSFYNSSFPKDTPTTVYLEHNEIRGIKGFKVALDSPDEHGAWTLLRKVHGLEIEFKRVDQTFLRNALAKEAERRSAKGSRFNHYPVTLTNQGSLRVALRHADRVLAQLANHFPIYPDEKEQIRRFESLPDQHKEDHILALALAGDTIGAIKAARQHYECSLTEAKSLVEGLMRR